MKSTHYLRYLSPLFVPVFLGSSYAAARPKALLAQQEVIGDDGYNKTYNDESKSFKDRMKEARNVPVVDTTNEKGGFFLGVGGGFGPVYDAEAKSSSGLGISLGVEPGYTIQPDSFGRLEFGVQVAYNSFNWKIDGATATMTPLTIMPRIGWGNSLGNNLMSVAKLGFGLGTGQRKVDVDGTKYSTNSASGFLLSGDYDVIYASGKVQFFGGLGVVHHRYSWSGSTANRAVPKTANSGTTDDSTNLNFVNAHGGIRVQF